MSLLQNRKSFREQINNQVSIFIESIEKVYQSNDVQFQLNRSQIFDTILETILPPDQNVPISNQMLSNFLQQTLNNETEKKLKKIYCNKQMTHISGGSKLFGLSQSGFASYSHIKDSSISHKSMFSSQTPFHKSVNYFQQILPSTQAKQEGSSIVSNKSESQSGYYSKGSEQNKKSYKLYPNFVKLQAVEYAANFGIKQACVKYKVPTSKINLWSRSCTKIKQVRGRKPIDPGMEQKVCKWLKMQLDKGTVLTQKIIRQKAKKISCSDQFKASKGWLQKFFRRRPELFQAYSQNRKSNSEVFNLPQIELMNKIKKEQRSQEIQDNQNLVKNEENINSQSDS